MFPSPAGVLSCPPTRQRVLEVLAQLEPTDVVGAAAHLLTPVDVAVGLQVRVEGGVVRWRGEQAQVGGAPWGAVVSGIADLVVRARVDTDVFLSADGAVVDLLKVVRSGAYCHLAGSRELFDGPHVTFAVDVPAAAARVVAALVADGESPAAGEMYLAGRALRVRADAGAVHVEVL